MSPPYLRPTPRRKAQPPSPLVTLLEDERLRLGLNHARFAREHLGLSAGHWHKLRAGTTTFGERSIGLILSRFPTLRDQVAAALSTPAPPPDEPTGQR
jgi:hypothetical protein